MKVRSHSDLFLRNQHFAHVTGFQVGLKINTYVFSMFQCFFNGDTCRACIKTRATLERLLAACDSSMQKYTWRHNLVLTVLNITQVLDIKFLDITKTS